MNLSKEKVMSTLLNILKKIQEDIVDKPENIDETTKPIGDLHHFDSLVSVEVTGLCLEALGFEELPSFPSIFIENNQALTIAQVADRLIKLSK